MRFIWYDSWTNYDFVIPFSSGNQEEMIKHISVCSFCAVFVKLTCIHTYIRTEHCSAYILIWLHLELHHRSGPARWSAVWNVWNAATHNVTVRDRDGGVWVSTQLWHVNLFSMHLCNTCLQRPGLSIHGGHRKFIAAPYLVFSANQSVDMRLQIGTKQVLTRSHY